MNRPCVCGGSNENCRYCSGRGELSEELADALITYSHSPKKLEGGHKSENEIRMELEATVRDLERQIHRFQPRDEKPKVSASPLVPCPMGCGAQLEPPNISRHLKGSHKFTKRAPQPIPASRVSREELQHCPICKALVKPYKLQRHLKKVHKSTQAGKRTMVFKPAGGTIAESVKDILRDSTTLAAPRDKNLDATKLYAHVYREQGRFGSHPSHDGFDDESGPE